MIGCGQYAFATIGYFLWRRFGRCVSMCYDIDDAATRSFARFYSATVCSHADVLIQSPNISTVFIASNHASHADYAIRALTAGKTVYVEKPVAVTMDQLRDLRLAVGRSTRSISFGFNRPFSKAVSLIRTAFPASASPMTLSCFITGHVLRPDHWYRRPEEGTRICGNVAHWLDLAVHILSWRGLPDRWTIALRAASADVLDDNVAITLTSERGDLISIVLTSRAEPFEGINETINLQVEDLIVKIDDFREMKLWRGEMYRKHRFRPKDVGHAKAVMQPFDNPGRDWAEIEASALLMLHIKEMVESGTQDSTFSFLEAQTLLTSADTNPGRDRYDVP
ncbi:MAG: Gfo/Idh/MocA family oxidoreductase [Chromatiales bacterium]|nr:Gfo/Idh/MocA family oxidoreductase [Chromatiales bacterium]